MDHSFLWNLTLGPIVAIYKIIFEWCYLLTHNYGVSLLLLSAATSILMFPLGKWASKIVSKQKKVESILRPQILRIKRNFRGSERHSAIARLYKRYRYNPLQTVLGATGVLIQLPFLIGAFYMLTEFTAIQGVSFGPIRNLAEPDQLIGLGINVLPFVMTFVNMASTFFSSNFSRQERVQAYAIAFLFLVLLYKAPSALLVYWTCNNLIALIKVIIERILQLKNALIKKYLCKINLGTITIFGSSVAALLFFLISRSKVEFFHAYSFYFKLVSDTFFIISILLCLLGTRYEFRKNQRSRREILFIGVGLLTALTLVRYFSIYGFGGSGYKFSTLLIINFFCVLAFRFRNECVDIFDCFRERKIYELFLPLGIFLATLIFLFYPYVLFSSDKTAFFQDWHLIIESQILYFEVVILLLLFLNYFFTKDIKIIVSIIVFALILTAFIWNLCNDPKLGAMSNFEFQNAKILGKKSAENFYLVALIISFVIVMAFVLLLKTYLIKNALWLLTSVLIVLPLLNMNIEGKTNLQDKKEVAFSSQLKEFLTFTKSGRNIIVVMLDMFSPSDMWLLLKADPTLEKKYADFTWYPDTLSSGISTIYGKAPLLGGEAATPWELNKDNKRSLEEKVNLAWSVFFRKLIKHGYQIELNDNKWYSWFDPVYYEQSILSHVYVNKDDSPLIETWDARNNYRNEIKGNPSTFLTFYGLFKLAPISIKKYIYDNGKWLDKIDRSFEVEWSHREVPLLDALSTHISFTEQPLNKFKFISTLFTHAPWNFDLSCKPSRLPIDSELYSSLGIQWDSRLQSELCALKLLSLFLEKLKENGAYNNTMVLIVSDHGTQGAHIPDNARGLSQNQIRDSSLLLVKGFDSKQSELKISHLLTTNYDVPLFIENSLEGTDNAPWKDLNRARKTVHGDWQRNVHPSNSYHLQEFYTVKGSLFNNQNWEKNNVN